MAPMAAAILARDVEAPEAVVTVTMTAEEAIALLAALEQEASQAVGDLTDWPPDKLRAALRALWPEEAG